MKDRLSIDREKIDTIDEQLARLFEERFHVVEDVVDYKIDNHMQVLDSSREAVITKKNVMRIQDENIRPYFKKLYMEMLRLSREYQQKIMDEREDN